MSLQPALAAPNATLVTKPGKRGEWNIIVLLKSGATTAAYTLPIPASSPKRHAPADSLAVGDPLAPENPKGAIEFGEDERAVDAWVRPLSIPNANCVLAEQEFGFQVILRNHTIICADHGHARKMWFHEDSLEFSWSSVDITTGRLLYYQSWERPGGPDDFTVTSVTWTGAAFEEKPAKVSSVVAGSFSSIGAAVKFRDAAQRDGDCGGKYFYILPDEKSGFILGAKTSRDRQQIPLWKEWQSCYPGLKLLN